ncbi:lipopolysaccharide biosynthesis protein [Shewanella salipaludis]|uniref:Oligosaccharide flippase family protein n=1 Tax=Shewanella salipaludis TaxID=2723052 RepID=A0A972FSV7_9GAMM|nr:oligosaccharide flippase family protein [Shewanella salipaludis]NMH65598.1 oligosaccharide flippase family protein [Shewanella salipaludis]
MSFAKNTSVYLISNILNAAAPFLLLPLLTRWLGPEGYGKVAMFQTLIAGMLALIGINTVGAASRKYYDDMSREELGRFNFSCIYILFFTLILSIIMIFTFGDIISVFLNIQVKWIYAAIVIAFFTYIINFRLVQWQVRNKAMKYCGLQVSNALLGMLATLFLVKMYSFGEQGRVDALLYTSAIFSLISVCLLIKDKLLIITGLRYDYISEALKFGVPLTPHVFGAFLLSAADRFVINDELGVKFAGIYMVSVQVSMALAIIFDAINKAYVPWLFSRLKNCSMTGKYEIVKNTYLYFISLLVVSGCAFFIGPLVIELVVNEDFYMAKDVIGWLCLGQVFGGMYLMVTNYIFYEKSTTALSIVTIACGLGNLLLMLLFIGPFGVNGVAFAFVISKLIQFLVTWVLANKVYPMPWLSFLLNKNGIEHVR